MNIQKIRYSLLTAACFLALGVAPLHAQTPTVKASIEPDSIMIGDRFTYSIVVERDLVQVVNFPEFTPNKEGGLELVESMPVDTLSREGRRLKLRKRFVMTTFDEGRYNLGVAKVLYADKNIVDTLYGSDSLRLEVGTFKIDSTSQSIYDLKAQMKMPFRYGEISGYVKWIIIFIIMLLVAIYALKRIMAHYGKSIGDIFKPAPPEPPHVVAIKALEHLHNQKLWQNSKYKLYYSTLTDILRSYIVGRYGIGAMEMTSDEIIEAMRDIEMPQKSSMDLRSILKAADLVKFAKAEPDAEQNEADYLKAYYFVEETKIQEEPAESEEDIKNKIDNA